MAALRLLKRPLDRRPGRRGMAAASELFAHERRVHARSGAQGELDRPRPQLAQRHAAVRSLDEGGEGAELLNIRVRRVHLLAQGEGNRHDDDAVVVIELHVRDHPRLHREARLALRAEEHLVDGGRVNPRREELRGDAVRARGGVGIDKAARVGGDRDIERQGDLRRDGRQLADNLIDNLAAGGALSFQTRLGGEELLRWVVIDGEVDAPGIGLGILRQEGERGDVHAHDKRRLPALRRPVGRGVGRVRHGDLRVRQEVGLLADVAQRAAERGGGADRIAVRADVREQEHPVPAAQQRGGFCNVHAPPHFSSGRTMSALAGFAGLTWLSMSRMCAPWAMDSSRKNCSSGV